MNTIEFKSSALRATLFAMSFLMGYVGVSFVQVAAASEDIAIQAVYAISAGLCILICVAVWLILANRLVSIVQLPEATRLHEIRDMLFGTASLSALCAVMYLFTVTHFSFNADFVVYFAGGLGSFIAALSFYENKRMYLGLTGLLLFSLFFYMAVRAVLAF